MNTSAPLGALFLVLISMAGIQNIREGLTSNLTKVIVIAIVITFVGSIGWAGFFSQGNANAVAKIGSKEITASDVNFEAASQQFLFNQRFPDQQIEDDVLVEISIESLIRKFGILNFIESEGLYLTDSFIFKELSKDEQFNENGKFSKQNFDAYARSNGFIPQDYLNRIKQDLTLEFWKQSITNSSFISKEEVQEVLLLAEQERDITFIKLPVNNFSQVNDFSEEELQGFYEENINNYVTPKKTRLNYIVLSADDLRGSVDISDSDILSDYQIYIEGFDTTERKSVSHIMINIDSNRTRKEAIKILENTKERLLEGEDFKALVLEISEDEGTKESEGSLGITDGTLLPDEFEEALSGMTEDEVYGPIELNSSVHLIKLTNIETPEPTSIEDMREQIKENLTNESASFNYGELLDNASDLVFTMGSIDAISKELNLKSIDSGLFALNEVNDILNFNSILEIIFDTNLENNNLVELVEISNKTAILFERSEFQDEKVIEFNSIKNLITKDYELKLTKERANDFITQALSDLENGGDFKKVALSKNAVLETYKGLKRDSSLLSAEAISNIFSLPRANSGNAYGSSVAVNGDFLIYRLDAVSTSTAQVDSNSEEGFYDYLNEQRALAEYSELFFAVQENSTVTRSN